MSEQEPDIHVLTLMDEALHNGALGPEQIVATVEPHLSIREKQRAYRHGLLSMAKSVIRQNRSGIRRIPNNSGSPYATMRNAAHERQVKVKGNWKLLIDCTAEEIDQIVIEHSGRAKQLLDRAQRYQRLATAMREHRVATARQLPDGIFEAVLTGLDKAA